MKKQKLSILVILTFSFSAFTTGYFLGRNQEPARVELSVPASVRSAPIEQTQPVPVETELPEVIQFPININTADKDAFMALPGIGDVLAQRILDYRDTHGDFSNEEGLMNVEGIGEKRMEEILELITIGG